MPAVPWKSGASAPRPAPQNITGLQPLRVPRFTRDARPLPQNLVIPNRAKPDEESAFLPTRPRTGVPHVSRLLRDVGFHELFS